MTEIAPTVVPRRPADLVMRLKRLGSLHQSRLSFMRILLRRMASEAWEFSCPVFEIDNKGVGHAVYTARGPERAYSLVVFAHDLPAEQRSDRVIATAWDATFSLFDGVPGPDDIARLRDNVPKQEAGRVSARELSMSRANRSVRLWDHVVEALSKGRQPDAQELTKVGYLMRTTAVYGSGKFGAADRERIAERPEMQVPFQAEMLSVYLTRTFVRDLVEHMARVRGGAQAVSLDDSLARLLGIGNSTGLGMAPFLINHPVLFNNWIMVREEAIARVCSVPSATRAELDLFQTIFARFCDGVALWQSEHPVQQEKLTALRDDLAHARVWIGSGALAQAFPWRALTDWAAQRLSEEGQEALASLMLEPYGPLVDGLACCMADTQEANVRIDGAMPVAEVLDRLKTAFGWALDLDWSDPQACARAWYVSAEKLEPRLGERLEEPIEPYEEPLAPARDAAAAYAALRGWDETTPVAAFLLKHPEHRHTLRRAQLVDIAPYGEIRDNTIAADMLPIDMLRAKLSFFGATQFDPRSDRWVRICMYAGAPYPQDLSAQTADHWVYPETLP